MSVMYRDGDKSLLTVIPRSRHEATTGSGVSFIQMSLSAGITHSAPFVCLSVSTSDILVKKTILVLVLVFITIFFILFSYS